MGGGASNSTRSSSQRKSSLPGHVQEMLQQCLLSLPFPPGTITQQTIDRAAKSAERVEVLEPQVILTKGQKAKGIYIIISGEVHVVSSSGIVIATLTPGQLFGEVSTLYQILCTATVKTPSKVLMLHLKSAALKAVLKDRAVPTNLLDYFVKKRYLDTSGAVNQSQLMRRIAQAVLEEVPLFRHWGGSALQSLVEAVEADGPAVTLAPAQSIIAMEGDPADEIVVIAKGRVEVLKQKELLATLDSSRWPVWLGEEGLFTGSHRLVSAKTTTACQLIIIKNALVNEVIKKFKKDAAVDFNKRLDKWRKKMTATDLRKTVDAYYRLEVLIQRLSETTLLANAPVDVLYKLALSSTTLTQEAGSHIAGEGSSEGRQSKMVRFQGGQDVSQPKPTKMDPSLPPGTEIKAAESSQVFWADDTFLLVMKGTMILNDNEEWITKDGEVLWLPRTVYPNSRLTAKRDSVILVTTGSALDEACSDYPDLVLTVPPTVR